MSRRHSVVAVVVLVSALIAPGPRAEALTSGGEAVANTDLVISEDPAVDDAGAYPESTYTDGAALPAIATGAHASPAACGHRPDFARPPPSGAASYAYDLTTNLLESAADGRRVSRAILGSADRFVAPRTEAGR